MTGATRHPAETIDRAMRWALVKFNVALDIQRDEDRAAACAENGWLMRDASRLYSDVIALLFGLATGSIDADVYLQREDHAGPGSSS